MKRGAAAGPVLRPKGTAVGFDDCPGDGQSQPRAPRLGGEEGIEDTLQLAFGNPVSESETVTSTASGAAPRDT